MLLVLVTLVPMLLWAAGLTLWSSLQERRTMERGLSETARALTIAVEQEIRLTMAALDSAALSPALVNDDVPAFADAARRLAAIHPEWNNTVLYDANGQQVQNSLRPHGTMLPALSEPGYEEAAKAVRTVIETGRPAVSNLFYGQISGTNVLLVAVPVRNRAGLLAHVLAAAIRPERLGDLLAAQQMPEGWFASVIDSAGIAITRVPGHDQVSGLLVPDWVRANLAAAPHGIANGTSLVGDKVTVAYERSNLTGWSVIFGANRSLFHANLRGSLVVTVGFGALVLAGSLLLAFAMARRILGPVQALTAAARPFIEDRKVAGSIFGIAELDAMHQALDVLTGELAKTQQHFLTFFSAAPVMLFVQDEAGRLIAVNDAWLRTLGYDHDEVLGRCPWEFHTEQSRAYGEAVVWPDFLKRGQMDAVWGEVLTKTGEVRDVLVSLRADRDGDGHIIRTIGAVQDVTEQRRAENALARAVEEAERANDSKTRFLAAASHDLRQPLQALALYLGVLKARLNGREEQVMDAVGQCIEALTGLLNDMLDVARLDAGVITPKLAEVPVNRLLERVAAAWRIQAEAKGLRLEVVASDKVVHTDPALMDRVLSNLVANAVRYTEHGRILVGCRTAGPGQVRLEVWDTGIGIPNDKLGEIFEEFRQLGNPERRRDRGTGLGLAIVQRIADLLGHRLCVRSVAGKGSVFTVTVPAAPACSLEVTVAPESHDEARRILVVDDEIHVRNALELVLGEMGHRVEGVETVEDAVQSTKRHRPELVIADFRLADGKTGIDVIRAVRGQCGNQVPAVVLTGDTDPATIRRIVGEGLHLLHKPVQLEALRAFLKHVA
ncbi:MAG: PAS domain S-box protein [Rhodospirillaceae bacterium]|nr:PAS domain S-box protein [Rhodospirillales bacterium]